ncbi:MAG: hypothetical protein SGPRY_005877, partial [Prymnesium sp.]
MLSAASVRLVQGGAFYVTQGFLRLIRVTVERVAADRGSFLYFSDDQSQLSPTVVLTFVDMRQTDCSSLIVSESPSARLVLQQVSSSCANHSITSDVGPVGCDQRYTDDILGLERGVCASSEPEACSYTIGSSLAGVTCRCTWPDFANPEIKDASLAPYLVDGCMRPIRLNHVVVISSDVEASLLKEGSNARVIQVTLRLDGENANSSSFRWSILNISQLAERSPWLSFPVSGEVMMVSSLLNAAEVVVPLVLSASGLRERVLPYMEEVPIFFSSGYFGLSQTRHVKVSLTVRARTSLVVWYHVAAGEDCDSTFNASNSSFAITPSFFGAASQAFTACDLESLPVQHQLPNLEDSRKFAATLRGAYRQVDFVGDGRYLVLLGLLWPISFTLQLQLDELFFSFQGTGFCSGGWVELADSSCGCPIGREPSDTGCRPCPPGKQKLKAGNDLCIDTPSDILPFVYGPLAAVSGLAALCYLLLYLKRKRQEREIQLERSFMGITSHEVRNPINGTVGWLRFLIEALTQQPDQQDMACNALRCAQVAVQFLESLSVMYKLKAGRLVPTPTRAVVKEMVEKIDMIVRPQMASGVELVIRYEEI